MAIDARKKVKDYLESRIAPGNLTEDDGATLATFIVCFGHPNYSLMRVFIDKEVDLIFILNKPESEPLFSGSPNPCGYRENVPIITACIDKIGITAEKLNWKAESELRRVVETWEIGSHCEFKRMRETTERIGKTTVTSTEYMLEYEREV